MQNQLLEMKMLVSSFDSCISKQMDYFATSGCLLGEEARPGMLSGLENSISLGKPKVLVLDDKRIISSPLGLRPVFLALSFAKYTSLQSRLMLLVKTTWHYLVLKVYHLIRYMIWSVMSSGNFIS